MLQGTKKILKSKTIWGGFLALAPFLEVILTGFGLPQGVLSESIAVVTGAAGGLMAIYGRITATNKISIL